MKKYGYTLAEVMVTLAVIGVIAAVMLPLANKYKPDATKVMYLKTYDSIAQALNIISGDSTIYPEINGQLDYSKVPFMNTAFKPTAPKWTGVQTGAKKLCGALSVALSSNGNPAVCSNDYISEYADNLFNANFNSKNGVSFMVTTNNPANGLYQTDIYIDVNGTDGNNCIYSDECTEPDRFKFIVAADGTLRPADRMGATYLKNRSSWKFKKYNADELADAGNFNDLNPLDLQPTVIVGGRDPEPGPGPDPEPPTPPTPPAPPETPGNPDNSEDNPPKGSGGGNGSYKTTDDSIIDGDDVPADSQDPNAKSGHVDDKSPETGLASDKHL